MVRYNSDNMYQSYVLVTYDDNNVILQLPRDTLLLFTLYRCIRNIYKSSIHHLLINYESMYECGGHMIYDSLLHALEDYYQLSSQSLPQQSLSYQ